MQHAEKHFDLAVIGGGPAGAAAAITAARSGVRVVLFDAKDLPRHRVCGEFVSAESLDVLSDLLRDSATGRQLIDSAPPLRRARLFLGSRMVEAPIEPAAVSITRYNLDAALWSAAQSASVTTRAHCEVSSVNGDGPFDVVSSSAVCKANAVVIATGRWSQFTPHRSVPSGPKWIGVKGHFHEPNPAPSSDLYFFDHGYCGVQPVSADVVNACAMVRSDRATSLQEVFALHPRLSQRASTWNPVMQPVSTSPLIYRQPQPTQANKLCAGDAAAFIDPFVGDGISIALRSGSIAAQCLGGFFRGEAGLADCAAKYDREYSREFAPLLAAASRVRSLLSLNGLARAAVFELLRFPGLMPLMIRKTRRSS